jgi:biopolymer transport protein ExbB
MKRIAVSLGSLSLILMQTASAEHSENNATVSFDSLEKTNEIDSYYDGEDFALSEETTEELDDDLASLEEEFEDDFNFEEPQESPLTSENEPDSLNEISEIVGELSDSDPILADTSLEKTHIPLTEQQAIETKELVVQSEPSPAPVSDNKKIAFTDQTFDELESDEADELEPMTENLSDSGQQSNQKNQQPKESVNDVAVSSQISTGARLAEKPTHKPIEINPVQIFAGSPTIYLILLGMSIVSVALWLLNLVTLKKFAFTNHFLIKNVRNKLMSNQYDEVMQICKADTSFFAKMMLSAVSSRKYGLQFMLESMKSEGKRSSVSFWQRLNIIHDIAIIAPLIGLMGTVLGMLYAFYDLNRSIESISSLFDGLGVSVGTTVSGIFVAILAMVLHSISKYRLVKSLTFVENEAVALAHLIDNKQNQ